MRPLLLTLVGLGLSASAAFAQAPPKPVLTGGTVPFKLLPSRHMLIELSFNGRGPYRVIFDTGAPLNLVTEKLAKETGIAKGKRNAFSFLSGPQVIEVDRATLGEVVIPKLPVVVMDHPTVRAISNAFEDDYGRIDGIVGFPLFARFATTIDYEANTMKLDPTDYQPGDFLKELTESITKSAEQPGPRIVGGSGLWGFQADATARVTKVAPGSPADKAGLKVGDQIVTLDGRWTTTQGDLALALSRVAPGNEAEIVIERDGKRQTLTCTPKAGY